MSHEEHEALLKARANRAVATTVEEKRIDSKEVRALEQAKARKRAKALLDFDTLHGKREEKKRKAVHVTEVGDKVTGRKSKDPGDWPDIYAGGFVRKFGLDDNTRPRSS